MTWTCSIVHISHSRSKINHYWVRDYQFGACASARCFSAGLLCLRGSTSVFFFPPSVVWTEAAVLSARLAQPPSHTEGLQYWSDVLRLLFVWPLSLHQPRVATFSRPGWHTWSVAFAKMDVAAVRFFNIASHLVKMWFHTSTLPKFKIFS